MPRTTVIALAAVAATLMIDSPTQAFPQFFNEFKGLYLSDSDNQEYADLVKEAKCLVCHQGKKKKNKNVYGAALDERLSKADKKDKEKIIEALKEVAELHSEADNEESPTFGELVAEGKLPGGDLEDLKQEPEANANSGN